MAKSHPTKNWLRGPGLHQFSGAIFLSTRVSPGERIQVPSPKRSTPGAAGFLILSHALLGPIDTGAPQPLAFVDFAAQIRSDFGAGKQSCAGPFSSYQNHMTQANCFQASPLAQSKPSVLTAQTHAKQRLVNLNTGGRPSSPKLAGVYTTASVAAEIPTLNSEASCHLADDLAVDQNARASLPFPGKHRTRSACSQMG